MDGTPLYAHRWVGAGYDALASVVYAPLGGLAGLRAQALDAAPLVPAARVLELGCGTGGFTRLLSTRAAHVTSVDKSPNMMARARRRAPTAELVEGDITTYRAARGVFDIVWCAFVLHELDRAGRAAALAIAHQALAPGGTLVIVEHALPTRGFWPRVMSRFVHAFEPTTVVEWVRGGFTHELLEAGFAETSRTLLARGTAVVLTCAPR
ncbi:MAG: methyltransferase domain-containing protein [Kofleriaceae bacterium]|nr:methyltransferase domain-containing protein [Kofleriaceae bacterium]